MPEPAGHRGRRAAPVKNAQRADDLLQSGANYWLLPRLKLFHREYPKLQVHLVTTYKGLASLDDGIDIAVRMTTYSPSRRITGRSMTLTSWPWRMNS
ncbi:LysR substrate-binding domain-containing protein [Mesorhizobium sp.]|uniref:LysR substrate-binding domain-containing protein n=1 Tax=Mesorhizobium sp. TaxID=1871066 RepID=UPI00338E463E